VDALGEPDRLRDGASSADTSASAPKHDWVRFRLGRTCSICKATQATDEFDDGVPCARTPKPLGS
jgi:hypothetical protein